MIDKVIEGDLRCRAPCSPELARAASDAWVKSRSLPTRTNMEKAAAGIKAGRGRPHVAEGSER